MDLEQTVKDLQTQNAQFKEMMLSLSKGQEELKALLLEKKKDKKAVSFINPGRRRKGQAAGVKFGIPNGPEEETENDSEEENVDLFNPEDDDEDYENEQYSPRDDKYKLLEERMLAMEGQKAPGLDFESLGLVSDVTIPRKFKIPTFTKYDGASCPQMHLRAYVRKIQPYTTDRKLWIHFFQESLSGTQLEWYYQLESSNIRTWTDLATAFYKHYQYNSELAPTRLQLQNMTMGSKESFKEYAQKWRDLAGRVKPPMTDRELVDMFMGTLTGPFYSHLLGSSSSGFTELILTGERVESGIRSGKIQAATSASTKKSYQGKNESNAVYSERKHNKKNRDHTVGAVTIAAPPSQNFQHRQDRSRRQFTKINMTLTQALQSMLKANLITLRGPPANPNTTSPRYNPNARCAYHSDSPGHDTNDCWLLKNKIQDMIDAGEIEFDPPATPNVITAPMPNHDQNVNVVDDNSHVTDVADLASPLLIVKKNLLQAGLFPGCAEDCDLCVLRPNDCLKLKNGIQRLMDDRTILFERVPKVDNSIEEVSVIARSKAPVKITATRVPVKITAEPKVAPLIITAPGPVPYSSSKAIPWNYGGDVYIHGIKQVGSSANPNDIVGTSKVTRSGRIYSPEISPPAPEIRGKRPVNPPQSETSVEVTSEDVAKQEMEEMLKIIRKSDFDVVEQLGHTPSKISMLSLLLSSESHANALMKFLKTAHVPQETSVDQFEHYVANLTVDNGLGFSDADLTPAGKNHNKALHISIECEGITLAHVLIDNGSSLNVLPKAVLDKFDYKGIELKPSDVVVRAYDGAKSVVYGEVVLPIKIGPQVFNTTFHVMDIRPAYSCLLGRPWIHGAGAVASSLHQKLKYPIAGMVVTVCGEEEYIVSSVQAFKYVEMDGEFFETPSQSFEVVPPPSPVLKPTPLVPKVVRAPPVMISLKDAQAAIENGDRAGWGQLINVPYKSDKAGLGFNSGKIVKNQINAMEDADSDCDLDSWIFPTIGDGLNNWKAEDTIPISFSQE